MNELKGMTKVTGMDVRAANLGLAFKYDAFNDPTIRELGLCPICLIEEDKCFCRVSSQKPFCHTPPKKSWWRFWS